MTSIYFIVMVLHDDEEEEGGGGADRLAAPPPIVLVTPPAVDDIDDDDVDVVGFNEERCIESVLFNLTFSLSMLALLVARSVALFTLCSNSA